MKITKRPLTTNEMDALSNEMRDFPHIGFIDQRLWMRYKNCFIATHNNAFVGVCVAIPLRNWVKLGPFVIRKKFQGQGYGDKLLSHIVHHYKHDNLYIGSANPKVWHITGKLGFWKTKNIFRVPFEIHLYLFSYVYERFSYVYVFDALKKRLRTQNKHYYYFFKRGS